MEKFSLGGTQIQAVRARFGHVGRPGCCHIRTVDPEPDREPGPAELAVVPSASAPGHAERMARHGARAALRLPLFEAGPPVTEPAAPECWGCGRRAPAASWLGRHGWVSRLTRLGSHKAASETYCGSCFAEWGWPDGDGAR